MNTTQFVNLHKIKACSEQVESNPNMNDKWADTASHFKVTLTGFNRQMTVSYSIGSALRGEPQADDVLDCLAIDASFTGSSFEDFASELGYDPDSRKAEKIYKACLKNSAKLKKFLNGHFQELIEAERL